MTALLVVASVAILFFLCRSLWLQYKSQQVADRRADALHVLARLTDTRRRVRPLAEPEVYQADLEELLEADDDDGGAPTSRLVFDDFALSAEETLEWERVPTVPVDAARRTEDAYPIQAWTGPPPAPPRLGVLDPPAPAPSPGPAIREPVDWLRWAAAGAMVAGMVAAVIAPLRAGSGHHRLVIVPAGVAQPPALPIVRRPAAASPAPPTSAQPAPTPAASTGAPSLIRLSPASGQAGQTITLYGDNLFSASGTIGVTFGGASGYVSCPARTTCQAVVPAQPGPTRTVPVVLTTDSGSSRPLEFTYRAR